MSTKLSKDDAYSVPDSTDWLSTPLSSLSAVDSALRCQVCKDFYNTPMITSCAHTFCSVCIRRCLSSEGKCPACRTNDQELKLRFNGAMEEVVQAFIRGRDAVLEYARTPKEVVYMEKNDGKRSRAQERDEIEEGGPRKRTRASTKQISSQRAVVVDSEDDADEYLPEGFVHCPICNKEVKEDTINAHIDRNCEDELSTKSRSSSFQPAGKIFSSKPTKSLERLPQINYSMMKDGPLRKKLADAGLLTIGSRQLMIQRYSEWVTVWNANCDATRPKTKMELKKEMDIWERTQGGRATTTGNIGPQIRDKDFDGAAWSMKHESDFKSLIANARKKVVKPSSKNIETDDDEDKKADVSNHELAGAKTNGGQSKADERIENMNSIPLRHPGSQNHPDLSQKEIHSPSSIYRSSSSLDKDGGLMSEIATKTPLQP